MQAAPGGLLLWGLLCLFVWLLFSPAPRWTAQCGQSSSCSRWDQPSAEPREEEEEEAGERQAVAPQDKEEEEEGTLQEEEEGALQLWQGGIAARAQGWCSAGSVWVPQVSARCH